MNKTILPKAWWCDREARLKYYELFNKKDEDLTEEERRFVISMYHQEEYTCGLDGD